VSITILVLSIRYCSIYANALSEAFVYCTNSIYLRSSRKNGSRLVLGKSEDTLVSGAFGSLVTVARTSCIVRVFFNWCILTFHCHKTKQLYDMSLKKWLGLKPYLCVANDCRREMAKWVTNLVDFLLCSESGILGSTH
jgi:hypothetical protein